jgi:IS30 family transposase
MKNFYELQDIKSQIEISLTVEPIIDISCPNLMIKINRECLYNGITNQKIKIKHKIGLLEKLDLQIQLRDKDYKRSRNTAIVIDSLQIDLFEIIPQWTKLAQYENDQNITQPTNYLGFNGTWNLNINEPFYRWKHRITAQGWLLEP